MASSDEEGEVVPDSVTNYYFLDCDGEPVSFAVLPLHWSNGESKVEGLELQIRLKGTDDSGFRKIYKQVMAWKFGLSYEKPEISVLTKDRVWIKLLKPLRRFEHFVRSVLITLECLHFAKRNPESSRTVIWTSLQRVLSSYEVEPSENDLFGHTTLIYKVLKRDTDVAKSMYLRKLLLLRPHGGKAFDEQQDLKKIKRAEFIDDDSEDGYDGGNESDEDEIFDTVCSFCDNGGEILSCEGVCVRSFHPTLEAGAETSCESLGFSDAQVKALNTYQCDNCRYKQHQCFACGKLGSSDRSSNIEVFPCASATCGHFYHPRCLSKLVHQGNEAQTVELAESIVAGNTFTCPLHRCFSCQGREDKKVYDLQFAICRRCPKAYHRTCLPWSISESVVQRAWEGLLPNRIMIYCMDHVMLTSLKTPPRGHVLFPDVGEKKKNNIIRLRIPKTNTMENWKINSFDDTKFNKVVEPSKQLRKDNTLRTLGRVPSSGKRGLLQGTGLNFRKPLSLNVKPQNRPTSNCTENTTSARKASQSSINPEMEKRMKGLMEKAASTFDEAEFRRTKKVPSTYSCSSNYLLSKLTLGKVDHCVKAVRAAAKKLDEGCSIEEAKAICDPEILPKIMLWKRKLEVYLAPFLHGPRYTSFGRHFTKIDKLKEIVDRLHWYVQPDDMIVDFCCGSNDFSCLMKEKLESTGKMCSFKNYDLHPAKNDFNFELRDWMSVRPEELARGPKLIMGLNPPFGYKASLANKFINKALEFQPKLLILIVPKETRRLQRRENPYDVIWEDEALLSRNSFYLPGSVDTHDKQLEQWNLKPPPLYLLSRPDFTADHMKIAEKNGHVIRAQAYEHANTTNNHGGRNYLMEDNVDCFADFSHAMNFQNNISCLLDDLPDYNDGMGPEEALGAGTRSNEALGCGIGREGVGLAQQMGSFYCSVSGSENRNGTGKGKQIRLENLQKDDGLPPIDETCVDMDLSDG